LLNPERLEDVNRIEQLNTCSLNNNEFYGLVKRAAAEVLLDRDLNSTVTAGGETRRSAKSDKKSEGKGTTRESSGHPGNWFKERQKDRAVQEAEQTSY